MPLDNGQALAVNSFLDANAGIGLALSLRKRNTVKVALSCR